jgi:uncharacterized membrane protein YdbT with pleckstrin-like domain
MGYAESMLARGEVIAVRGRQHWLATVIDGRRAWATFLIAVGLLLVGTRLDEGSLPQSLIGYLGGALLLVAVIWLAVRYWDWRNQEYLITNRRVLKVEGIINKRAADSSLEKINDAVLDQNMVGRIFGYADLDILTAADQAIDKFRMLNAALAFKRVMLEQKHALELELGRSGEVTGGAAGSSGGPEADTVQEITEAIDDLADLRDRGAISGAEYEAKKAELLRRL